MCMCMSECVEGERQRERKRDFVWKSEIERESDKEGVKEKELGKRE